MGATGRVVPGPQATWVGFLHQRMPEGSVLRRLLQGEGSEGWMGPSSREMTDEMQGARREAQLTLGGLELQMGLCSGPRRALHFPETTGAF